MFERDLDNENEDQRERVRFWLTIGLGAILTGIVAALVLLLSRANDDYDRSLKSDELKRRVGALTEGKSAREKGRSA